MNDFNKTLEKLFDLKIVNRFINSDNMELIDSIDADKNKQF